jgi:hypothetical protein
VRTCDIASVWSKLEGMLGLSAQGCNGYCDGLLVATCSSVWACTAHLRASSAKLSTRATAPAGSSPKPLQAGEHSATPCCAQDMSCMHVAGTLCTTGVHAALLSNVSAYHIPCSCPVLRHPRTPATAGMPTPATNHLTLPCPAALLARLPVELMPCNKPTGHSRDNRMHGAAGCNAPRWRWCQCGGCNTHRAYSAQCGDCL